VFGIRPGDLRVSGAFLLAAAMMLAACGGGDPWERDLRAHRARLDAYFRSDASPLDPEARASFPGLDFYPPDPSWRLETVPDRTGAGAPAGILDSHGEARDYIVHSRLTFHHGDDAFTLTLYRSPTEGGFFLPFRDGTGGTETYGAGRYVEAEMLPEGRVRVDFNLAMNPYCAYSARWACPLVPEANVLDIPVRAGEKRYPGGPAGH